MGAAAAVLLMKPSVFARTGCAWGLTSEKVRTILAPRGACSMRRLLCSAERALLEVRRAICNDAYPLSGAKESVLRRPCMPQELRAGARPPFFLSAAGRGSGSPETQSLAASFGCRRGV